LDTELRFHVARDLHGFVAGLIAGDEAEQLVVRASELERQHYHLRITRKLAVAKEYLRERYGDDRDARFGMVASSRDKELANWGVPNGFNETKRVRVGPWYGDGDDGYSSESCRRLESCVTEFGAQGLELDAALLAWGTDFVRTGGAWSIARARAYRRGTSVRDPFQLRRNAYRVLLTRGRDGTVVFVPEIAALDETYQYLVACGFRELAR
jgi:hypothetical protein